MNTCNYCGHRNIEGDDECAECGQSLADAYLAAPNTEVERSLLRDRISLLEPRTPITVEPATPTRDVLRLMVDKGIGCVVVVDDGRPVGIFSERDAVRKIGTQAVAVAAQPISKFMTPDPQTLVSDAKIAFAVQHMDMGGYRHLPIVDDRDELVGVISARDILRHLSDSMAHS